VEPLKEAITPPTQFVLNYVRLAARSSLSLVYSGGVMSRRTLVRLLVAVGVGLLFGALTTIAAPIGLTSTSTAATVAYVTENDT
jgi:hypothetical protein